MAFKQSPFPGMDPYLETHWLGIHVALIAETSRTLNRMLPDDLAARMEERIAIDSDQEIQRRAGPDVFVYEPGSAYQSQEATSIAIEAPYCLVVDLDPVKQRFVRIIDQSGSLITVIEFISPSNKLSKGLDAYLEKRDELLGAGVHLVEIDLVRQGDWKTLLQPHLCPRPALSTYRVTVRIGKSRRAYLYPIRLQDPLPEIQIPLRPGDPKVMLALQPIIETIYTDGRFGRTIDYTRPLNPPLTAEDGAFAASRISQGG